MTEEEYLEIVKIIDFDIDWWLSKKDNHTNENEKWHNLGARDALAILRAKIVHEILRRVAVKEPIKSPGWTNRFWKRRNVTR